MKFLEYEIVQYGKYYGTPKKEVRNLLEQRKDVIFRN